MKKRANRSSSWVNSFSPWRSAMIAKPCSGRSFDDRGDVLRCDPDPLSCGPNEWDLPHAARPREAAPRGPTERRS